MEEILDVTKKFKRILRFGIATPYSISLDKQSDIFYEWFLHCLKLPETCNAHIYNDDHVPYELIKKRMESIDYHHELKVTDAGFFICEQPMYFWEFDHEGIIFTTLTNDKFTFEDWCSKHLFDLRIQASLSLIIRLLQNMGDAK